MFAEFLRFRSCSVNRKNFTRKYFSTALILCTAVATLILCTAVATLILCTAVARNTKYIFAISFLTHENRKTRLANKSCFVVDNMAGIGRNWARQQADVLVYYMPTSPSSHSDG